MARTDNLRQQHQELVAIVKNIESKLNPIAIADKSEEVHKLLVSLAGKLSIHLAMEDKSLYPAMIQSSNAEAKEMARKFMAEMGTLSSVFKDYVQKWPTSAIQGNPGGFIAETRKVFAALADRVKREEGQLYNLADKI